MFRNKDAEFYERQGMCSGFVKRRRVRDEVGPKPEGQIALKKAYKIFSE